MVAKQEKGGIILVDTEEKGNAENGGIHTPDPSGTTGKGTGIRQGVSAEGAQAHEGRGHTGGVLSREGGSGEAVRGEFDKERGVRGPSVELGNPSEDIGQGTRLTPPSESLTLGALPSSLPHDIILDSASDIGANMGAGARFDANLDAIRTLKVVEAEGQQATPQQQAVIARYSGFGDSAFNDAFRRYGRDDSWQRRGELLKELTTDEEYEEIERARLTAYFTTPEVIDTMWNTLREMGADKIPNPRILEPSAGSGRFLGFQPVDMAARSQRVAVELDDLSSRMLKQTYPQAEVYGMGYEKAPIAKDSVDIAISNVPFGNFPVNDPTFTKGRRLLTRSIHNYFFAKALEHLRPGGVLAFVTSRHTMDSKKATPVREMLAEQADLLGAIRLPKTAFPDTDVVTDMIFMRKRLPGDEPGDKSWVNTDEMTIKSENWPYETKVNVNQYYLDNPGMVLGKQSTTGTQYRRDEYTVEPHERLGLPTQLGTAMRRMPRDIITDAPRDTMRSMSLPSSMNVKEGARVVADDGTIMVKRQGDMVKADLSAADHNRVREILKVRDEARTVLNKQLQDAESSDIEAAQLGLRSAYNSFVIKNGPLNTDRNTGLMDGDPDAPFLRALEKWDKNTPKNIRTATALSEAETQSLQMPIFNQRVVHGMPTREINTDTDAVTVSLNETGRLDFDRMGELLGRDTEDVRRGLADKRMIYKNPIGDWETSDKYLTGDVREKLRTAKAAASANKAFQTNVEALEVVQPEDLPPSQISVRLGTPWVSSEDVNDFVTDLLQPYSARWRSGDQYFKYVPETGDWVKNVKIDASSAKMTSEWGTSRMPANEIISRVLSGKFVEVFDRGDDDKPVRNPQETIAAQEKAQAIQQAFKDWIWQDPDRTERLIAHYNETYNTYRPRVFDGAHQELPGMSEGWFRRIHPHQKDAIWRVVQDRTSLLAHEVGFGKTAVMVGAGMELRRLGLSQKNLYVVPKATHKQFVGQFKDIYPYANVLAPDEKDFTPSNRQEFISRAVTGDWDAVVLSDSQFRRIPVKPETEAAFLRDEVALFRAALEAEEQQGDEGYGRRSSKKSASHKEIQKALIRVEERLAETQAKIGQKHEDIIFFEELGVDQLFVDEADMYKNLRFATRMGRLKGLPNTDSERAWDMYQKTRYLQQQGKGQGVVFATGTPVANTIAEMYTMMRYLQEPMLEAKGLQHFDAWAKTFGETTESLEQTPTGAYRLTQRFAKFVNTPELSNIWQNVSDIRVAEEVPAIVKQRPRLVDEEGKERRTVVSTPPDDALLNYMKSLAKRADELSGKDPREDNMLKIANDARLASLDMRMVDPRAPVNPDGKVAMASRKIAEIYRETDADRGAQLVFLDLGTPKASDKVDQPGEDAEIIEDEPEVLRNVYGVIKSNLIASGLPEKEIAFIHDAKTGEQKEALFAKVNNGDIRVLVGSTGKLGVGVNVQERAAALHHLDAPWRPRDIEQREGRIIRQGNLVYGPKKDAEGDIIDAGPGVRVYTYVTERSFDAYMWQAIEAKSKAIKAIMRRDNPPRNIEDIDSLTMSAGEAKAVASGNPDIMKAVTLKNNVNRLQMLQASHLDATIRAKEELRNIPKQVEQLQKDILKAEKDAGLAEIKADFTINVRGKTFTERPEAAEAIKGVIESATVTDNPENAPKIGQYKGFDIYAFNQGPLAGYKILIRNPETGYTHATNTIQYADLTAAGAMQRIDNKINALPGELEKVRQQLESSKSNLNLYQEQVAKPFEYSGRLEAMETELNRLERKLQGQEVPEAAAEVELLDGELLNGERKPEYHFGERAPEEIKTTVAEVNKAAENVLEESISVEPAPVEAEMTPVEQAKQHLAEVREEAAAEDKPATAPVIQENIQSAEAAITKAEIETPGVETMMAPEQFDKAAKLETKPVREMTRMEREKAGITFAFEKKPEALQTIDQIYDASLEEFRKASQEFKAIQTAYRSREIGDDAFLKGKAEFNKAEGIADAAEMAYIEARKEIPVAPVVEAELPRIPAVGVEGKVFYAHMGGELGFVKVPGVVERIIVLGHEEHDFYLHHELNEKGEPKQNWIVSEGRSGLSLGEPRGTALDATNAAIGKLKKTERSQLTRLINDAVERQGESPSYKMPEAKTPEETYEAVKETWQMTNKEFVGEYKEPYSVKQIQDAEKSTKGARGRYERRTGAMVPPPIRSEIEGKLAQREATVDEMRQAYRQYVDEYKQRVQTHYEDIEKAIKQGKPVPPEVLADYPDLAPPITPEVTPEILAKVPYYKETTEEELKVEEKAIAKRERKPRKPREPKVEVKPKRKVAIVSKPEYTMAELREIHEERSPQAKALDNALTHQVTMLPDHPKVRGWAKNQGRGDILGIDSPPRVKRATVKTPKLKKPKNVLRSKREGKIFRTKMRGGTALSRRPLRAQKR